MCLFATLFATYILSISNYFLLVDDPVTPSPLNFIWVRQCPLPHAFPILTHIFWIAIYSIPFRISMTRSTHFPTSFRINVCVCRIVNMPILTTV